MYSTGCRRRLDNEEITRMAEMTLGEWLALKKGDRVERMATGEVFKVTSSPYGSKHAIWLKSDRDGVQMQAKKYDLYVKVEEETV